MDNSFVNFAIKAALNSRETLDRLEDDFQKFTEILEHSELLVIDENNQKSISFNELMSLKERLPKRVFNFLMPATFFQFNSQEWPPSPHLRIPIGTIIEFLSLKISFNQYHRAMSRFDTDGTGTLTREQFSKYYQAEVMSKVDVLKDLEETFKVCYLNTVESMFFFFLDAKHNERIRITDAIICGFLETAFGLQANKEEFENWFSPDKTMELNSLFQMYDSEQKNYLNKGDFRRVHGTFTSTFVDRLFETHVQDGGDKMIYDEFVIFQIANNHLAHPSALAYFFKVLDVDGDGFLTRFEFRYFYTDLRIAFNSWFMEERAMPEFDDFMDGFFDMVKPLQDGKISLRELVECKQGHDFILCLISHSEFYRFETKDSENGGVLEQDSEMPLLFGDDVSLEEEEDQQQQPILDEGLAGG